MSEPTSAPPSFSTARRWGIWLNVLLSVAAMLALVVMVNYLASGYHRRFSLTANTRFDLSPQTSKLLHTLTNDVNITIFFDVRGDHAGGEAELYGRVAGLLKEYHHLNPRVKVKTIDYTRFPGDAAVFLSQHKLSNLKDKEFIHFASGGQAQTVYGSQLSDYNVSEVLSGESPHFRRITFRGEMLFTAALFAVTHPRSLKAYFLTGHGEHDPENTTLEHGYGKFAAVLKEENNIDWAKLTLSGTNDIPVDCQLLIIAGPTKARLAENELQAIRHYLNKGRRLLILLNRTAYSGVESILTQWGIEAPPSVVADPENVATENDLLVGWINAEHEVTKSMFAESLRAQFVLPRVVSVSKTAPSADAPKVDVLFQTGTNAIARFPVQRDGKIEYMDRPGTYPLAVAVEQGKIKGVSAERGATRIIVTGDSDFLDNQLLDSGANHYFAGFAANWLLAQSSILLEGLGPRPVREYRLNITDAEFTKVRWIFLAGVPGAVLLLGGFVWLRRRR